MRGNILSGHGKKTRTEIPPGSSTGEEGSIVNLEPPMGVTAVLQYKHTHTYTHTHTHTHTHTLDIV